VGHQYGVLTIFFVFIFPVRVSYKDKKYSDFGKTKIYSDFQKIRYTKTMTYFQQDLFPEFESESSSGFLKLFSDCCSNGCACEKASDHDTEFVLEEIDFEK
jgi:hypothetical protein